MTRFHSVLVGAYPRSEGLIKKFRAYSKGKLGREELWESVKAEAEAAIKLQKDVGLRYVVDGMLDWHDLLRPIAENLEGVELDGLSRWFDNNTFYKKPIITGYVSRRDSLLKDNFHPELISDALPKLVLPDPYTFTALSDVRRRFEEVLFEVAEALGRELAEIEASTRLGQVQLSAPYLVWRRLGADELELAGQAIEEVFKDVRAEKMLHLYFGDALNALPQALDYEVDVLGFDMTSTSLKELGEYSVEVDVALGLIDGRNSLIERIDLVERWVESYLERNEPENLYVTPSCDLEFLPPSVAEEKVRLLGRVVRRLREEVGED